MGKNNGSSRFNYQKQERRSNGQFGPMEKRFTMTRADFGLSGDRGGYVSFTPPVDPPLGTMTVSIFGEQITLTGGPYRSRPKDMFGVKMAAEIDLPYDVSIPTQDFRVPDPERMYEGVLTVALGHFVFGQPIYVDCMAGRGRTGMFMATIAHLCGVDDPVRYVRSNYYEHAVETAVQEQFVLGFNRQTFRRQLMKLLIQYGAINFTRLRRMSGEDRLLLIRTLFSRERDNYTCNQLGLV